MNGTTPLIIAAEKGHEVCMRHLLEAGANVNAAKQNGATPLFIAAEKGHEMCMHQLLEAGANIEAAMEDGVTPLFIAVEKGHEACMRQLLEAGANVNAAKQGGATPLYVAAYNGRKVCMRELLEAGANIEDAREGERERERNKDRCKKCGHKFCRRICDRDEFYRPRRDDPLRCFYDCWLTFPCGTGNNRRQRHHLSTLLQVQRICICGPWVEVSCHLSSLSWQEELLAIVKSTAA